MFIIFHCLFFIGSSFSFSKLKLKYDPCNDKKSDKYSVRTMCYMEKLHCKILTSKKGRVWANVTNLLRGCWHAHLQQTQMNLQLVISRFGWLVENHFHRNPMLRLHLHLTYPACSFCFFQIKLRDTFAGNWRTRFAILMRQTSVFCKAFWNSDIEMLFLPYQKS